MKIIDLLNKIVKGEAPKKIKYNGNVFVYYERLDGFYNYKCLERNEYFSDIYFIENILNDEVEVIEEEKDIEKLKNKRFTRNQKQIANKINELIDIVNKLNKE